MYCTTLLYSKLYLTVYFPTLLYSKLYLTVCLRAARYYLTPSTNYSLLFLRFSWLFLRFSSLASGKSTCAVSLTSIAASMAVAWLHTQRVCFDAFFIDDGHKFDDIIVELFHVAKMLSFGGALMLHDNWMP